MVYNIVLFIARKSPKGDLMVKFRFGNRIGFELLVLFDETPLQTL